MAWQHRSKGIVLVERPPGWRPCSEFDMPARARVIEVVDQPVSDPVTYVRQYNALSLDEAGTTWAAMMRMPMPPGQMAAIERFSRDRGNVRLDSARKSLTG